MKDNRMTKGFAPMAPADARLLENGKIVTTWKNAKLQKYMDTITKAHVSGVKNAWTIANSAVRIMDEDCWHDDFKDQKELCAYLGISEGTLSQWKTAVEFAETHKEVKALGYSVTRAYLLGNMKEKKRLEFVKWCAENKIDVSTDTKLKEAKAHFKKGTLPISEEDKQNAIEAETADVAETTEEVHANGKFIKITYDGNTYAIPEKDFHKVLKKYLVKE